VARSLLTAIADVVALCVCFAVVRPQTAEPANDALEWLGRLIAMYGPAGVLAALVLPAATLLLAVRDLRRGTRWQPVLACVVVSVIVAGIGLSVARPSFFWSILY